MIDTICHVQLEYLIHQQINTLTPTDHCMNGRTTKESWMCNHTMSHHGGVVGPDQVQGDYTFRLQDKFSKTLNRQVDEAVRLCLDISLNISDQE